MDLKTLQQIKEKHLDIISLRKKINVGDTKEILVCGNVGCQSAKGDVVYETFIKKIKELGLKNIKVNRSGCVGPCGLGPNVIIYPEEVFYCKVDQNGVDAILSEHIIKGNPVESYLYNKNKANVNFNDIAFYKKQLYIARNNFNMIDPESVEEYITIDGYLALFNTLTKMKPAEVIEEVKKSGLRGRGGAGFPTGTKWEFTASYKSDIKYVVCNADEGDPGAFMDRAIIEDSPHKLIEAMTIAGYAIGADRGIVYIRAEYPVAGRRLRNAIAQAKELGLLGKNIFGTAFSFDLDIKYGAGAFVCGEETSLINSIEGKRGEPRTKPPFPAEKGVFNYPTLINNVETYANIPQIIIKGANWFASIGKDKSKGTKVFSLTGKIVNSGLIELPMGTTIREIIYDIGGGIPNGKKFKAVQIGGPSGGCLPASLIDTPVTYEDLIQHGAMMGSGGMIVLDEDTNMVEMTRFFLDFTCDESCGKCTPCRIGNKRLLEILDKILEGKGEMSDLDELETLSTYIKQNSLCGLGQTSPNPVLSTLQHFRNEYVELIEGKKVKDSNGKYKIIPEKCVGCSACARVCPVNCISGELRKKYVIDQEICIACGKCAETCKFHAISK
ncbi:nadh-quinone oxidoreductase subunit f [Holotrichia oblita]|nr:nadh-quinone oxidoreductase subunit f [Holotrichia oblita]